MARIVDEQTNIWARSAGIEAQRTDLWVVDFTEALAGIKAASTLAERSGTEFPASQFLMSLSDILPDKTIATYYVKSVTLPELRVRQDVIRRDSRPYNLPSWDDPLDAIRISFFLDCFKGSTITTPYQSDIYNFLDFWRAMVRAGRGGMADEYAIRLNNDYRIDYAYNVTLKLLSPGMPTVINGSASTSQFSQGPFTAPSIFELVNRANASQSGSSFEANGAPFLPQPATLPSINVTQIQNDLTEALTLKLINCWLGSFKVSDLSYDQGKTAQIDATFYAENIQQPTLSEG